MINNLIKLATHLDRKGLHREADYVDVLIRRAQEAPPPPRTGNSPRAYVDVEIGNYSELGAFTVTAQSLIGESPDAVKMRVQKALPALIEALESPEGRFIIASKGGNVSEAATLIYDTGAYNSRDRLYSQFIDSLNLNPDALEMLRMHGLHPIQRNFSRGENRVEKVQKVLNTLTPKRYRQFGPQLSSGSFPWKPNKEKR